MSENTYDWEALAAPFAESDVKFKPGQHRENDKSQEGYELRAMAYVDARAIMDRLDEIIGQENWQDDYRELPNGSVECKISIRIGDHWIHKTDVGTESDYEAEKGAYSDAFKRACVKLGIGRYLYSLASFWWPARRVTAKSGKDTFYFIGTPALPKSSQPYHSSKSHIDDKRETRLDTKPDEKPAQAKGTVQRPFKTVEALVEWLQNEAKNVKASDKVISQGQASNVAQQMGKFLDQDSRHYLIWLAWEIESSKELNEREWLTLKAWCASPIAQVEAESKLVEAAYASAVERDLANNG